MRIMGLDLGTRTIGVAVSDEMGLIARGIETIRRSGTKNDLARLMNWSKRKKWGLLSWLPQKYEWNHW